MSRYFGQIIKRSNVKQIQNPKDISWSEFKAELIKESWEVYSPNNQPNLIEYNTQDKKSNSSELFEDKLRKYEERFRDLERRSSAPTAPFGAVCHVLSTTLLGLTAITMANSLAGEETVHKLASVLLIFLGASYIVLFLTGRGSHTHNHNHSMEKMAVAGLILLPALSPCATTLPVFLAVGNSSSSLVLLAILVLLLSTLVVMITLVTLSFYGASQLKFHWIEKYDKALDGSVLCLVGFLNYLFHHHDEDHDFATCDSSCFEYSSDAAPKIEGQMIFWLSF
ncbi:hypothetical protein KP509_23G023800 [Ceratopteris richardii]|uniref:Uncharacterized protein n=1 Tax=Ceratopteris richardii TaxID=49495 RepID=A0A8T2S0Z5_CERRI|nr:hypothetical protein KP509_23G023800 [Ceratopteris richardii]